MEKRGLIVIIGFIFLFIFIADVNATEVNITLAKKEYGEQQPFDGYLNFDMDGVLNTDNKIFFIIDEHETEAGTLGKAMDYVSKGNLLAPNLDFKSPQSSVKVIFNEKGSKTDVGIDFTKAKQISSIDFDIVGSATKPIDILQLDFKGDGIIDWSYRGENLVGNFPDPNVFIKNDSYLFGFKSEDVGQVYTLNPENAGETFCEKVWIEPSSEYYIEAKAGRDGTSAGKLNSALVISSSRTPPATISADECHDAANNAESNIYCCELKFNPASAGSIDKADLNCKVAKEINKKQEAYICIFQSLVGESGGNYTISEEIKNEGSIRAYYTGSQNNVEKDFMIRIYSRKFNTLLKNTAHVSLKEEDISAAKIRPKEKLAIKIISNSAGEITFSNLNANVVTLSGAASRILSFSPITELKERINYTGVVSIPLYFFANVLTPNILGRYFVSANLEMDDVIESTNEVNFKVVAGPKAVIIADTVLPSIGDNVNFDATASKQVNATRAINSYLWDFGDNATASDAKTSHAYLNDGKYAVRLTIVDNAGISGSSVLVINVRGSASGNVINIINSSLNSIINSKKEIEKNAVVKETADSLGILTKLSAAQQNLSSLMGKAQSVVKDERMNDSIKTQSLAELKTQAEEVMKTVPISMEVSVLRFDAKVDTLEKVPNAKIIGVENIEGFKEKMLVAQKGVSVESVARDIKLKYKSGESAGFVLIEKIVSGGEGIIYEILPLGLTKKEILSSGAEGISEDDSVFKIKGKELKYTAEGTIEKAAETRTLIVPDDLSTIGIDVSKDELKEFDAACGNGLCEAGETATCKQDCEKLPWILIISTIIAGLIGIGAVYYFMVFKKKNPSEKYGISAINKDEKDKEVLKNYVSKAMHEKGFSEQQLIMTLRKKGWKDELINEAISEAKKEKHSGAK